MIAAPPSFWPRPPASPTPTTPRGRRHGAAVGRRLVRGAPAGGAGTPGDGRGRRGRGGKGQSDADAEVSSRCKALLPQLEKARIEGRIKAFLADGKGRLPGWEAFAELAGDDGAARNLTPTFSAVRPNALEMPDRDLVRARAEFAKRCAGMRLRVVRRAGMRPLWPKSSPCSSSGATRASGRTRRPGESSSTASTPSRLARRWSRRCGPTRGRGNSSPRCSRAAGAAPGGADVAARPGAGAA